MEEVNWPKACVDWPTADMTGLVWRWMVDGTTVEIADPRTDWDCCCAPICGWICILCPLPGALTCVVIVVGYNKNLMHTK